MLYKFGRLIPTKIKNPASYPEAGYLLLIPYHALPFWVKVEANIKNVQIVSYDHSNCQEF